MAKWCIYCDIFLPNADKHSMFNVRKSIWGIYTIPDDALYKKEW